MAQKKVDGVLEVVRYDDRGQVELVRAYERRGPEYGDHVLLTRDQLVARLKSGKIFFTGTRTPYLAGTFKLVQQVHLVIFDGKEYLVTGEKNPTRDNLHLPLF